MFELMDAHSQSAVIKVIGVGGGGGNAVSHMVDTGIEGVDFHLYQHGRAGPEGISRVRTSLQIGCNITKGLGAGAESGHRAAGCHGRPRSHLRSDRRCRHALHHGRHGWWYRHGCDADRGPGCARNSAYPDGCCRDEAVHDGRQQANDRSPITASGNSASTLTR